MFGFPASTEFGKRIPKQKFYENIDITPMLKRVFVEQIRLIYWRNKLAATALNLAAGETVTEIEVFEVRLNAPQLEEAVLRQFKDNPEEFIIKAAGLINDEKATAIIQHITYNMLDEHYDTDIFTEPTIKGKLGANAIALHHGDNTFFIVHQQYLFHEWASFPRVLKSISYKSQDFLKSLYSTPKILAILS